MLDEVDFTAMKLLHERVGSSIASTRTSKVKVANALICDLLGELQKSIDFAHCSNFG